MEAASLYSDGSFPQIDGTLYVKNICEQLLVSLNLSGVLFS